MNYKVFTTKDNLSAQEFIELSKSVGWGKDKEYDLEQVKAALDRSTMIVTIRDENNQAIACGRVLSDYMFFSTVPDIFVRPEFQKQGLGKVIMQKIIDEFGHTKIFLGSQLGNEEFFEKLGFKKDMQSYSFKK